MKKVPLGEVVKYIRGITFKPDDVELPHTFGSVVCMRTKNVQMLLDESDLIAVNSNFVKREEQYLEEGDLLISSANSWNLVGKTCYVPALPYKATAGGFISIARPNRKLVTPRYLYYWLSSDQTQHYVRLCGQQTTNISNLNRERFLNLPLPLPPLEEQRRIATILDKADAVRRKRQSAIALTEELLRSVFLEMFGDPVTNPKGWKIVELEQVCHRVTDGTHQSPEWAIEGIPFLFVSNIINGEIDFNVSKYISEESWASLTARCPIEVNDILYTTVGSYGNAALVRSEKQFCFQRHIAHIKPDTDKIHPEFFLGLMQSAGVKQQADRQVRGVAQKTLNLRELKNFQVAVPPRVYQEQYVALRKTVEGCLNNQQKSFEVQDNLFNSLLQQAFRGEL